MTQKPMPRGVVGARALQRLPVGGWVGGWLERKTGAQGKEWAHAALTTSPKEGILAFSGEYLIGLLYSPE